MLCSVFSIFLRQQEELTQAEPFAIALGKKYEGHVAPAFAWDKETTETTMPLRPSLAMVDLIDLDLEVFLY